MQAYDLPVIEIESRESEVIRRRKQQKNKGLTFALWQSVTLAVIAYALTILRYLDLLAPAVDAVRHLLGV